MKLRLPLPKLGAIQFDLSFQPTSAPPGRIRLFIRKIVNELRKHPRVRVIGLLALLVLAFAIWMQTSPPVLIEARCIESALPRGTILHLEFARTSEDVRTLIGDPGDDRRCLTRVQILRDNAWVAMYMVLFIAVGLLLARRTCPWAKYLAGMAIVSGIAAAAFDWRENYYALQLAKLSPEQVSSQLFALHGATLTKWTLIFATMSLLAVTFFGLSRLASWVGFLFALTAAIGLVSIWDHRVITYIPLLISVSLFVLALGTLVRPQSFVEARC